MVAVPRRSAYAFLATIKVDGTEIASTIDLIEVRVHRSIGATSYAEIVVIDEFFELIDGPAFGVGKAITVSLGAEGSATTEVFSGEIAAVGLEQRGSQRHTLVVEAYDKSHRLGHATRVKTFLDQSYSDILSSIAGIYGLTADIDGALGAPVFKYQLQQESDLAFLDRIATRTGSEWFVDAGKLTVRPRPAVSSAVAKTEYGNDLLRFRARYSGSEHVGGAKVMGWDPATKQAISSEDTSQSSSPEGASAPAGAAAWRTAAANMNSATTRLQSSALAVDSAAEATQVAKGMARRQTMNELVVHGETWCRPDLKVGTVLEIAGVGTKLAGNYYVTEVEHRITSNDQITRFTAGPLEATELVDLLGHRESSVPRFTYSGLVVGVVTNNNDADNLGRVRVKFPGLSDADESAWARVVSLGAGATRGIHILPEIDDEVLVGFEHGDPRRPYVIGGLWNGTATMPIAQSDLLENSNVKQWQIKSRSGHVISIVDVNAADDKMIKLAHADGSTMLLLQGSKVELVSNKKPLEIKDGSGKASILLDGQGKVTIKGDSVEIKGQTGVKIESQASLELKGATGLKGDGGPTLELKSTGTAKVETSGQLTLKGSMTMIN